MNPQNSPSEKGWSSLNRVILGILLAIVMLLGLGWALRIPSGSYFLGFLGVILALGAGYWIVSLFGEGLAER